MNLEEIRRQKQEQLQEQLALAQQIEALELKVKSFLTPEALERYSNLKTAHQELALQALMLMGKAVQSGQVNMIDDEKLKQLLIRLNPKREFKIRRV